MVKSLQSTYENNPDLKISVTHKLLRNHVRIPSGVDSRLDRTPAQMMDRSVGREIPVLIEWRGGFQTTKSPSQGETRLDNLTEMLRHMSGAPSDSTSHPHAVIDFRILECLGWITDSGDFHRVGLVFRYPHFARNHGLTLPIVSLRDRIVAYRKRREGDVPPVCVPSLGARFALAVGLAKALGNLFLVNWSHRRLRSHNILFFGNETLDAPFLSGFTYARPGEELKISNPRDEDSDYSYYRPENYADLLVHYCKTSDDAQTPLLPVTAGLDVYALGVILLEIAEWRTVAEMEDMEKKPGRGLGKSQLIWKRVENLGARVGDIYQGVVERCLQEGCSDWKEKSVEEAMAVAVAVVEELSKCRA
ncbi:hypothetical protein K440DRAFT_615872 [Wilcoxina mikolae CBS 423.85]|nr:hypothetical protein K440DRAFT_615872 [Wilcoxina mikolae CBS 423.85]